jgi:hypothetical protein
MQPLDLVFALFVFTMLFVVVACVWQALARTLDIANDGAPRTSVIDAAQEQPACAFPREG